INRRRIAELRDGSDRTGEVPSEVLRTSSLALTHDDGDIAGSDVFIVTVPTPVDRNNQPDLTAVRSACKTVGSRLAKNAIVVFESTVYPGVTEDICGPALEAASGLCCGRDFFLGTPRSALIQVTESTPSSGLPRLLPGKPRRPSRRCARFTAQSPTATSSSPGISRRRRLPRSLKMPSATSISPSSTK